MRVGVGEYHLPSGSGDAAVWYARLRFLDAVHEVRPMVLTALRNEVLAVYTSSFCLSDLFPDPLHNVTIAEMQKPPLNTRPEIRRLVRLLENWGAPFNLTDTWVKEAAVATLRDWERFPKAIENPRWHSVSIPVPTPVQFEEAVFTVSDFWNAALTSWEDFERLI